MNKQNKSTQQLVLGFARQTSFSADDFMPMSFNLEALETVKKLAQKKQGMAYIYGPEGYGKSHLLYVAAKLLGQPVHTPKTLPEDPTGQTQVLIDMVDEATPPEQEKLFHYFNSLKSCEGLLMVAGRAPANHLNFLPDLTSRLKTIEHVPLAQPDTNHLELLLVKFAADRQLTLAPSVVRYLLNHCARSPRVLEGILEALDHHSLAHKRAISIPFIKQILKEVSG